MSTDVEDAESSVIAAGTAATIPVAVAANPAPASLAKKRNPLLEDDEDDKPETLPSGAALSKTDSDDSDDPNDAEDLFKGADPLSEEDFETVEGDLEGEESEAEETSTDVEPKADEKPEAQEMEFVYLEIYKPRCLECNHVVPWAEKKYKDCHFSNGNDNCPAQSLRIDLIIPYDQIVSKILEAEERGDVIKLAKMYASIAEKADWIQERVLQVLTKARNR